MPFLVFIVKGNFLVDDWGQLSNGMSLFEQINSWKSLWSYRPISWIAIPAFLNLFNDNFISLTIFHFALYFFSVFQIISWEKLKFNLSQKRIAGVLLASPVFASTFILSPVNQLSASLSFFFFSLGLLYEKRGSKNRITLYVTYFFFMLSLLCYEISLPLIFTHYLFMITTDAKKWCKYGTFPVVISLLVFWQKVIAVQLLNSDFSRLETFSLIPLLTFVFTYLVSIPLAIFEGLVSHYLFVLVIAILFYFIMRSYGLDFDKNVINRKVILILLIGLVSSSSLFLLSGRYSLIEGYQNRGLTSSWILFSLLLVTLLKYRKIWISLLIIFLMSVNYVLFVDKISDAVQASDARRFVVEQIIDQNSLVNGSSTTIIVDIPCLLPDGSSRSEVFCTFWDLRGALLNKGLVFSNVFVTEEALPIFLNDLEAKAFIQVVTFNEAFELVGVQPLTPELEENLLLRVDLAAKSSVAKIEACKSKITQLIKFQISGSLGEYLICARHPLS